MVAPLLAELRRRVDLTVYTQDDPAFPAGVDAAPRRRPRASAGTTTSRRCRRCCASSTASRSSARSAGRSAEWQRITGVDDLGADLPVMRPGCGSLSVDPDLVDELRVRFEGGRLRSRRIELAELEDEHRGDVRPRLDRRPARRAADRGAGAADARGHAPRRPRTSSPRCRRTSSTSPSRRSPSPP